jgi:crossover junction endodeoxyribonuclease RuvC
LAVQIEDVVLRLQPAAAVLETPFHGQNAHSLIVLAEARGAILATLARFGVTVVEYAPAAVKRAVTGNGRADKEQVARMVRLLLSLPDLRGAHDETDALALALCHAQHFRRAQILSRSAGGSR